MSYRCVSCRKVHQGEPDQRFVSVERKQRNRWSGPVPKPVSWCAPCWKAHVKLEEESRRKADEQFAAQCAKIRAELAAKGQQ